jgi:hypothetical protein
MGTGITGTHGTGHTAGYGTGTGTGITGTHGAVGTHPHGGLAEHKTSGTGGILHRSGSSSSVENSTFLAFYMFLVLFILGVFTCFP